MKKSFKYIILALVVIIPLAYFAYRVEGEIKPYYSGDAVYANGKLIFGSMNNDGILELFSYSNNAIQRGGVIMASSALLPLGIEKKIYDFALVSEGGNVFAYTAEGKKMSKYNVTNIVTPVFVKQVVDNTGDWFVGIKKYDGHLMTTGLKEVKLWNYFLQNIDNFKINNELSYNINISNNGDYIFNINSSAVHIFDTVSRTYVASPKIKIAGNNYRKTFFDIAENKIFVADDEKLNAIGANGSVLATYKHISSDAYDVDGIQGDDYVYMTNGLGVTKVKKSNMEQVGWVYTTNINKQKGGWAQGLNVVKTDSGEKLVVFNNSNILIMDSNLKVLGSLGAPDESAVAFIDEPLSLRLDQTDVAVNSPLLVSGAGFAYNEELEIKMLGTTFPAKADKDGRFKTTITVPTSFPKKTDIKVDGKASKLTYSIAVNVR